LKLGEREGGREEMRLRTDVFRMAEVGGVTGGVDAEAEARKGWKK
jgi:hypothetical protein